MNVNFTLPAARPTDRLSKRTSTLTALVDFWCGQEAPGIKPQARHKGREAAHARARQAAVGLAPSCALAWLSASTSRVCDSQNRAVDLLRRNKTFLLCIYFYNTLNPIANAISLLAYLYEVIKSLEGTFNDTSIDFERLFRYLKQNGSPYFKIDTLIQQAMTSIFQDWFHENFLTYLPLPRFKTANEPRELFVTPNFPVTQLYPTTRATSSAPPCAAPRSRTCCRAPGP